METERAGYLISSDPARLDYRAIHAFLTNSHWKSGVTEAQVRHAAAHSLCFGLYHDGAQVGYTRVLTDYVHVACIFDVYVLEAHRGHGLGAWLIEVVLAHPDLQNVQQWRLASRDARDFYRKFGFELLDHPERQMQRTAR